MPHRPIPSRTREDLREEVNAIVALAQQDGADKAAEYLRRLLQDEYDAGYTSGGDAEFRFQVGPKRRTRMPREAA